MKTLWPKLQNATNPSLWSQLKWFTDLLSWESALLLQKEAETRERPDCNWLAFKKVQSFPCYFDFFRARQATESLVTGYNSNDKSDWSALIFETDCFSQSPPIFGLRWALYHTESTDEFRRNGDCVTWHHRLALRASYFNTEWLQ